MSGSPDEPGHKPGTTAPLITERHLALPRTAGSALGAPGRTTAARSRDRFRLRDCHAAFNAAQLAMAVVDCDGLVIAANRALGTLLGADPARLTDEAAADLVDLGHDTRTWAAYHEVLKGRSDQLRCTRRLKHPDGHALWAEVTVAPVQGSSSVLLSVADISDRRNIQARLRHLRTHDPVTRLPDRTLFLERLAAAVDEAAALEPPPTGEQARKGTGRVGLCHLGLDDFQAVNGTLGHHIGDRLLAVVADRLVQCVDQASYDLGSGCLVARLGGDEFAVLVEGSLGADRLSAFAQSLLTAVRGPFELAGQQLPVSASIGVVERPTAATTATELMQAADTALSWAKADGKARWTLFDPERHARRLTRQALSRALRPAVGRGEFTLEYQPLVGLGDGVLRGVEALVRWDHPRFGRLAPNRFIDLAEENGVIVELGRWVLANACRQARRWQLKRPRRPVFVSVNVAVQQVRDSDLVADVAGILEETGLPPELLQLELTESAVMGSGGRPLQALHTLSDMGVAIAIDDFGTGYSNLAYLSRLPVSTLKLDGSFVQGLRDGGQLNPADETIVEALVELAHRLGLTVIAEYVENAEQARRLRRIGCDLGQGWFYSRPVPPDRIFTPVGADGELLSL